MFLMLLLKKLWIQPEEGVFEVAVVELVLLEVADTLFLAHCYLL